MSKDAIQDSSSALMDPNGDAFKTMLAGAKAAGEQAAAIQPNTSNVEPDTQKDEKQSVSSTEGKGKADEPDENLSDDVDTLKNQLRGLKAELTRVRSQRSSTESESAELKERIAKLEGRLDEQRQSNQSSSAKASLQKLTDDRLLDMDTAYEDELADARAVARLAERDGDRDGIAQANQRITQAREMRKLIKAEKDRRADERVTSKRAEADEATSLSTELESLFTDVYKAVPDLADTNSEIWKAGKKEYAKLPALTKHLGPLAELIATAAAISKNPGLIGKKATEQVLDQIEKVADKSFNKGGSAPQSGSKASNYAINSRQDALDFEEQVRRVKQG